MKAAARDLHLLKRRRELIERSIRQAIAGRDVRIESVELGSTGMLAGTHVASQERTAGKLGETPKLHGRVTFDEAIAGPLAISRR